jgi:N utilization substance protein B
VGARSLARSQALQVLYAWEARGAEGSPRRILEAFVVEERVPEEALEYVQRLVDLVGEHRATIDRTIQEALLNWRLERLSMIDRNILRLAVAEMLYVDDVPLRVSVQEAIHLGEDYGTVESPRFVNGVLDAVLRRLEGGAPPGGGGER